MRAEDKLTSKLFARSAPKNGNGHGLKSPIRIEWLAPVGRQRARFRLVMPRGTDPVTRERALAQFRSFCAWYHSERSE